MTDPLRVLHIIPYYSPAFAYGGTIRAAYELIRRLHERGHQVTVLTTDALDASSRAEAGNHLVEGVQVIRRRNLSNRLAWDRLFVPLGFWRGLGALVRAHDVVHLHEFRSLLNVMAQPHLSQKPYFVTPQGGLPRSLRRGGYKTVFDALFGQRLLDQAARLHALTEMEREQYHEFDQGDDRIVVLPNGIDVNEYDFTADPAGFKQAYGVPPNRPVVGFLARLSPIKGPDFLLDAFARVLEAIPEAVLIMIGPDDVAQADIEALIARLGIGKSVVLTGYIGGIEEKAAAYQAADVYVLPSRYEIQGITPLEALLNRTPTIVTDRCGLAHHLQTHGAATVVPFGDVEAFAAAIVRALREQPSAQAACAHVRETFNWEALVDRWEVVYRTCIEEA
ncbi:MAG: glycosyltransferase [Anaerolineae bacterium]